MRSLLVFLFLAFLVLIFSCPTLSRHDSRYGLSEGLCLIRILDVRFVRSRKFAAFSYREKFFCGTNRILSHMRKFWNNLCCSIATHWHTFTRHDYSALLLKRYAGLCSIFFLIVHKTITVYGRKTKFNSWKTVCVIAYQWLSMKSWIISRTGRFKQIMDLPFGLLWPISKQNMLQYAVHIKTVLAQLVCHGWAVVCSSL